MQAIRCKGKPVMRLLRFAAPALCLMALGACVTSLPAYAGQVAAPPVRPSAPPSNPLDLIPYDAAQRGPLLLIGESYIPHARPNEGLPAIQTLFALAERMGRKVVPIGSLTVLAPATMRVIVDNPGKPDVYAGLRDGERFKILLSQFSTAQWELAGSARGIGLADMTDTQRGLYISLLPEKMQIQRVKLVPTDKPGQNRYDYQGTAQDADPLTARLRLVRKVDFHYFKPGANDSSVSGSVEPGAGDEITISTIGGGARGDIAPDADTVRAYGVPIVQTVPNRLKPGMLNFAAPSLQMPVALDGEMKTLGELLARVAGVTHLDLLADKRVADLPVFLSAARGQTARAGDILQALSTSVTGAFRRVGASTYLLTDDAQGIGTRLARLDEWAETASSARYEVMHDLTNNAAKHDPLAHIGFAPGDPYALPPALQQRVDASYRKSRYNGPPTLNPSELPAALQQCVERNAEFWEEEHIAIRKDQVGVGTILSAQFVVGGAAVEASFAQNIGSQYLEEVAAPDTPPVSSAAAAPKPPLPMPPTLGKRVLVMKMPEMRTPADAKALLDLTSLARAKGFTEIWLHVPLDKPDAVAQVKAAIVAGRQANLKVGVLVSLLHDGGIPTPEDINIFGETGAQYAGRRAQTAPKSMSGYYERMAGWTLMDSAEVGRRVSELARTPGLSALALKSTAAPGWADSPAGGDAIPANAHFGYSVPFRLAYLRAEGVDPLDVTHYAYSLNAQVSLPFFPGDSENLWKSLNAYRQRENDRAMSAIYRSLKQAAPDLPLYTDDRVSSYGDPNTGWYARWDSAERLPANPPYAVESEARTAAFARSSEPLLRQPAWSGKPESVARAFGDTAQRAAQQWRGVVLDLTKRAPAEAMRIINALPDCPPPPQ